MVAADLPKPRRIELILRQLDTLPTLPSVAARLLQLTASDEANAKEVIELVASDPALTAKVLSTCRAADKGVRSEVVTVERAVVLLGFTAIRNTVLSLKVFELFNDPLDQPTLGDTKRKDNEQHGPEPFDRKGLWTHALAVGILAELIAKAHPGQQDLEPEQAFVCGLLHDIGKLALDQVLPRSYARVVEVCRNKRSAITEVEREIIGIDHHSAGKRLAEQWGLPHVIQDCIWLHGSPYEALPNLPHRRMIGLISLSDAIVRGLMLGFSGNQGLVTDTQLLTERLGLSHQSVTAATDALIDELERRGSAMGLDDTPSQQMLMRSIQQANEALGRLNLQLEHRSTQAAGQSRVLEGIASFHSAAKPGRTVQDVLDAVMDSAASLFGDGFYAVLCPSRSPQDREEWLIGQRRSGGSASYQMVDPAPSAPDLTTLQADPCTGMNLMGLLPWISDFVVEAEDMRNVRLLALDSGWGTAALLIHNREKIPSWPVLHPLLTTWGSAVAAANQHDGAKRLGEELNDANRQLAQANETILETESMARLGEMTAGAAHEMNNPLAIISGRAQLLSMSLEQGTRHQQAAQLIYQESHKLSDLITALHMFSTPPTPQRQPIDMLGLLDEVVRTVKQARSKRERSTEISLAIKDSLPITYCDPSHIARALTELLLNAMQSNPNSAVHLSASTDPQTESVVIQVIDDGDGMSGQTLNHAFDPFFSAKPAGRQVGMGLPRAQQLVLAHGGRIGLESLPGKGTTATLRLPIRGDQSGTTGTA